MKQTFDDPFRLLRHGYDTLIDVRSPAEFAADHIPGAINLPVLDNFQRAEVGTIYKQQSPFKARKLGAAYVAQNSAGHLQASLGEFPGNWQPMVYCWRGGQRSASFAAILAQIGWRVGLLDGGYQTWRGLAYRYLYEQTLPFRLIALDGLTGTAKTDILHRLAARGAQVLDLEGLAHHRGSMLGGYATAQPGQKAFESRMMEVFAGFDPMVPVLVEAESSKVGERQVPPMVWEAMKTAPRIVIEAPLQARADYLTDAYRDLIDRPDLLRERLAGLRALRGAATLDSWMALMDAGDFTQLARSLMEHHYDPAYRKSERPAAHPLIATLRTQNLDPASRDTLADRLAALITGR